MEKLLLLEPSLACAYVPDGDENSVLTVMRVLLDLWQALLGAPPTPDEPELQRPFYAVLMAIVTRPEFSYARLSARLSHVSATAPPAAPQALGGAAAAASSPPAALLPPSPGSEELLRAVAAQLAVLEPDAALCERYRLLLFTTLRLVTRQLGAAAQPDDLALLPDGDVCIGVRRRALSFTDDDDTNNSGEDKNKDKDKEKDENSTSGSSNNSAVQQSQQLQLVQNPQVPRPEEVSKSVAAMLGAPLPSNMDVQDVCATSVNSLNVSSSPTASPTASPTSSPTKKGQFRVGTPTKQPRAGRPTQDLTLPFAEFAQRFLAVAYWRLPGVRADIVGAVQARAASTVLPPGVHPFPEDREVAEYGADDREHAELLGWPRWHAALRRLAHDAQEERGARLSRRWLAHVARLGGFFVAFFCEWMAHTAAALGAHPAVYARLPGFVPLARAVYALAGRRTPTEPRALALLPRAELLLLAAGHPQPLNALVQLAYARTPVGETPAVVATLLAVDAWLADVAARGRLLAAPAFDADAFCRGLDVILQTDHHMILAKLLTMVHTYAPLFRGHARIALLSGLLLQRHFYHLFLHWNPNVRSIFIQVLVFKTLLTKRRYLGAPEKHGPKIRRHPPPSAAPDDDPSESPESVLSVDLAVNATLEAYLATVFRQYDACTQGKKGAPAPQPSSQKVYHLEDSPEEVEVEQQTCTKAEEGTQECAPEPRVPEPSDVQPPDAVPPHLAVYVVSACDEYRKFMARYNEWQSKGGNSEPPKLIAME